MAIRNAMEFKCHCISSNSILPSLNKYLSVTLSMIIDKRITQIQLAVRPTLETTASAKIENLLSGNSNLVMFCMVSSLFWIRQLSPLIVSGFISSLRLQNFFKI